MSSPMCSRVLLWASLFVLGGCRVSLNVPSGSELQCETNDDCPSGFRCTQSTNLCTSLDTDTPPSVAVSAISRARSEIVATLTVNDAEGDPVSITAEYTLGDPMDPSAVWIPATPASSSDPLANIDRLGPEQPTVFVWDALTDALAATPSGLVTADVVTIVGGVEQPPSAEVAFSVATLRFTPSGSESGSGVPTVSESFGVGNDPPTAMITSIPAQPAGALTLEITLTDSSADIARFEVEFRQNPTDPWRRARLILGSRDNLLTGDQAGTPHIFVWDSEAPLDPDPTVEQGIGSQRIDTVELRAWAADSPFDTDEFRGPDDVQAIGAQVVNQTPPRVVGITTPSTQTHGGVGMVPIHYFLIDEESDPADILVEVSFDFGRSWSAAREFLRPESEGQLALTTGPANPDGSGGVAHTFVWDPVGATTVERENTRVRIFANDGNNIESPVAEHQMAQGISPSGLGFTQQSLGHGHGTALAVSEDFNGDGFDDVILFGRDEFTALIVNTTSGIPNGTYTFQQSSQFTDSTFSTRFAAMGDLNTDGKPDFVVGGGELAAYGYINTTTGTSMSFGGPGLIAFPALGDPWFDAIPIHGVFGQFNSDVHLDLLVTTRSTCNFTAPPGCESQFRTYILAGDGVGNLGTPVLQGYVVSPVLATDIDADGQTDLIENLGAEGLRVLRNNGSGFDEYEVIQGVSASFQLADINGDGRDDLLGVNTTSAEFYPLFAQDISGGGPSFVLGAVRSVGTAPHRVAVGDVNGDGLLDVAMGTGGNGGTLLINANGDEVSVLFGNGENGSNDGTFGPLTRLSGLTTPLGALEMMDVDGDGRQELYTYDNLNDGPITRITFSNHTDLGTGQFSLGTQVGAFASDIEMVPADLNNDGVMDVVSESGNGTGLLVALGRGQSGFGFESFDVFEIQLGTDQSMRSFRLGDVNGDGAVDITIVVTESAAESYGIALGVSSNGAGTGEFEPFTFVPQPRPVDTHFLVDMNNDDVLDLVLIDDYVTVFRGNTTGGVADGTFTATSTYEAGESGSVHESGDVDADGVPDFVYGRVADLVVVRSNGAGEPSTHTVVTPTTPGLAMFTRYYQFFDVSDNGLPDVVMVGLDTIGNETIGYLPGGLSGVSATGGAWSTFPGLGRGLSLVDLNADGNPEALISFRGLDFLDGYTLNRTGGAFSFDSFPDIPTGTGGEAMATTDLDGDRLPDFVLSADGPAQATVVHSQLSQHAASNSRTLAPWTGTAVGAGAYAYGDDVPPLGTDVFGRVWDTRRLTQTYASEVARGQQGNLIDEIRREFAFSGALQFLTLPSRVDGDEYFARKAADLTTGLARLEVRQRFGPGVGGNVRAPDGMGLDLTSTPQRGVIVVLPVSDRRLSEGYDSGTLRVFRKSFDWVRADSVESSPDATAEVLPVSTDRRGTTHDVLREIANWVEIPAGNIDSGSGSRYAYIEDGFGPRVLVLTDELGIFVATVTP